MFSFNVSFSSYHFSPMPNFGFDFQFRVRYVPYDSDSLRIGEFGRDSGSCPSCHGSGTPRGKIANFSAVAIRRFGPLRIRFRFRGLRANSRRIHNLKFIVHFIYILFYATNLQLQISATIEKRSRQILKMAAFLETFFVLPRGVARK